jgi:Protein of unknown function DUF262
MKRADVVSVRSLFSGATRFKSAASHRGFVWGPPEVAQLLVDLEIGARDPDRDEDDLSERFYLGVISVTRLKSGVYELHDGQQRLTTLAMILAFVRDRTRESGLRQRLDRMLVRRSILRPPEPRLRLSPEDHAWYSHFILPPGATTRLPAENPIGSPRELLLAARFMEQSFLNYSDDDLWNLAVFATEHTAVVRSLAEPAAAWAPRLGYRREPDEPLSHYGIAAE